MSVEVAIREMIATEVAKAPKPLDADAIRTLIHESLTKRELPKLSIRADAIGCVSDDPGFKDNHKIINTVIRKMQSVELASELVFPRGDWFTYGDIELPPGMGIDITGAGLAYRLGEANYAEPHFFGPVSRIIRVGGGNCFVVGTAFSKFSKLVLQGRRIPGNDVSGRDEKADCGILFEGRNNPATSNAQVDRVAFIDIKHALWSSDKPEPTHADTIRVTNCVGHGIETWFRSDNEQAIGLRFDNNSIVYDGKPCVVYDLRKGGCVVDTWLQLCHWDATLLRLGPGNHNNRRFDIHFRLDTPQNDICKRCNGTGKANGVKCPDCQGTGSVPRKARLTLVECTKPLPWDMPSGTISGIAAVMPDQIDKSQLLKLNNGKHGFKFDVTNLEVK